MRIPLEMLPPDDELTGELPSSELIRSIRAYGVQTPIVVTMTGDGYHVDDGTRRIKASRIVVARPGRGKNADDLKGIPAMVKRASDEVGLGLTLALNAVRRPNPLRDLETIERLDLLGHSDERISKQTGLSLALIRQRRKLARLTPGWREVADAGSISVGVAQALANLDVEAQERILVEYRKGRAPTAKLIEGEKLGHSLALDLGTETPSNRHEFADQVFFALRAELGSSLVSKPTITRIGSMPITVAYPDGTSFHVVVLNPREEAALAEVEEVLTDAPASETASTS